MRQVTGLTSTYSSDEFGICSALFELGGLVVMHDASGCNSTYTTHDEPRWYDMDSMVYISAVSEIEAIMGDDDKLIRDVVSAARELKPRFTALIGAPIPYMIGTDLPAVAGIVEEETGIPSIGFPANGMGLYTKGISMALAAVTERFAQGETGRSREPSMNVIGLTPLDFSLNGTAESIWRWAEALGFRRGACMAMGSSLDEISRAGEAHVNLVVSYGGLEAARILERRYGTPWIAGVPFGKAFAERLGQLVLEAAGTGGREMAAYRSVPRAGAAGRDPAPNPARDAARGKESPLLVVGESVYSASFAAAVELELNIPTRVLCPVDTEDVLLREGDRRTPEEDDLIEAFRGAERVAADPLFRQLVPETAEFFDLPHEAFSGRIYDRVNRNMVDVPLDGFIFGGTKAPRGKGPRG